MHHGSNAIRHARQQAQSFAGEFAALDRTPRHFRRLRHLGGDLADGCRQFLGRSAHGLHVGQRGVRRIGDTAGMSADARSDIGHALGLPRHAAGLLRHAIHGSAGLTFDGIGHGRDSGFTRFHREPF